MKGVSGRLRGDEHEELRGGVKGVSGRLRGDEHEELRDGVKGVSGRLEWDEGDVERASSCLILVFSQKYEFKNYNLE